MPRREKTEPCCGKDFLPEKCPNKAGIRGLCHSCYVCAHRQVRITKTVTWEQLEAAGLAKPPKAKYVRKSRFDPAAYLDDLEKKRESEGSNEGVQLVG